MGLMGLRLASSDLDVNLRRSWTSTLNPSR
jgi:hypothetical protein